MYQQKLEQHDLKQPQPEIASVYMFPFQINFHSTSTIYNINYISSCKEPKQEFSSHLLFFVPFAVCGIYHMWGPLPRWLGGCGFRWWRCSKRGSNFGGSGFVSCWSSLDWCSALGDLQSGAIFANHTFFGGFKAQDDGCQSPTCKTCSWTSSWILSAWCDEATVCCAASPNGSNETVDGEARFAGIPTEHAYTKAKGFFSSTFQSLFHSDSTAEFFRSLGKLQAQVGRLCPSLSRLHQWCQTSWRCHCLQCLCHRRLWQLVFLLKFLRRQWHPMLQLLHLWRPVRQMLVICMQAKSNWLRSLTSRLRTAWYLLNLFKIYRPFSWNLPLFWRSSVLTRFICA